MKGEVLDLLRATETKKHHSNLSCDRRYLAWIRKVFFMNTSEYCELRIWNVCLIYTCKQQRCLALPIEFQLVWNIIGVNFTVTRNHNSIPYIHIHDFDISTYPLSKYLLGNQSNFHCLFLEIPDATERLKTLRKASILSPVATTLQGIRRTVCHKYELCRSCSSTNLISKLTR